VQLSGDAIRKLQQQYVEPVAKPNQPPQAPAAKEDAKKKQMDSGFSMGGKDRQDAEVDSHANEPSNPNGMPRQNQFEINERSYTEKDKSGKNAVAPFSGAWLRMPDSVEEQAWPFSAEDLEEGTAILGKYRVLEFLGVGGMASVFKAQRISDDRLFAIKLLDPTVSDDNVRKRFKLEFDLIQKIKHKNVVSMEEQVDEGQWIYTVMEYLPGGDLKSRIRRHLRREEAVRYASQIAASLEAAHKQGVLHRDLKPANVLFRSDGTLALVDFGGAKDTLDGGIRLTKEGQMIGTPYYASPEQATGAKMDKRSDLYALGVILFEMLEGRRPFIGDTSLQVLMAHVKDPVPLLSQEWDALNDVLAQLLAKSPADRFPDGQSVVMALSEASPGDVPADLLQG
jgi:serine/threonine protein kinase